MSFTYDNDLELQADGGPDWDTVLRANFGLIERGRTFRGTAGSAVNSGQIVLVNSAGRVVPYDARSTSLRWPTGMAYSSVSSGSDGFFVMHGVVRSMAIWSGHLVPGEPVFISPASLGFAVSSYPGAAWPVGVALGPDAVLVAPRQNIFPEEVTEVQTLSNVLLGPNSASNFAMSLARRAHVKQLFVTAQSADAFRVEFWSGSARVSSELLYATLTASHTLGNSVDVTTLNYLDQGIFPWFNTDVASPALVFGRVTVQSGCSVNSSHFSVRVVAERFR